MTQNDQTPDEFIDQYRRQLSEIDQVAQIALNGHLQVERALDEVIDAIFRHPQFLREARLPFYQRTQVVRAFTPDGDSRMEWKVILALNSLRNEIAHGRATDVRGDKIANLRRALMEIGNDAFKHDVEEADEGDVITFGSAIAGGFLHVLLDNVKRWGKPELDPGS